MLQRPWRAPQEHQARPAHDGENLAHCTLTADARERESTPPVTTSTSDNAASSKASHALLARANRHPTSGASGAASAPVSSVPTWSAAVYMPVTALMQCRKSRAMTIRLAMWPIPRQAPMSRVPANIPNSPVQRLRPPHVTDCQIDPRGMPAHRNHLSGASAPPRRQKPAHRSSRRHWPNSCGRVMRRPPCAILPNARAWPKGRSTPV